MLLGRVLAPLAVDQAAARCSYEHESGGDPPAAVYPYFSTLVVGAM